MNLRRVGILLGVASLCLIGAGRRDDGVTLRYKGKKGDSSIFKTTMEMEQTQTVMGMELKTVMSSEQVSTHTIDEIDADGNLHISDKIEQIKMKVNIPALGDYVFDSKSSERDKSSQLGQSLTPVFERLTGAVVQIVVTPRGEVKSSKGYTDLLKDLLEGNPLAAQFIGGGDDDASKNNFQQQFPRFGEKPLAIGDKWEVPFEVPMAKVGKITGKETLKYIGPDKVGDRETAKIESTTEMSFDLDIDMDGAKVTGKFTSTNTSSTYQFDVAAGRMLSHETSLTLAGDLNVAAGGMNIPVGVQQTQKIKVQLIDKLPQ